MSYAVEPCPSASSPEGVTKCVCIIWSSAARAFIFSENASVESDRYSAIAFAPSLPEAIIMPRAMSPSASTSPARSPIEEPSTLTISGVIVTGSFSHPLSNASSAVMIFVVLATGKTSCSFFPNKTVPLTGSYSTAAYAETLTDSAVSAETGRLPHAKTTASKTQSIFRKNHHLPRHVYAAGG